MASTMTRTEAIDLLLDRDVSRLSPERRGSLLLNWWIIDESDPRFETLPLSLRSRLASEDEADDPTDPIFDPLLRIALRSAYVGVTNAFLKREIRALGRDESIEGEVELLLSCPCCGYRTLGERGVYEICKVCFWEDDGTLGPDVGSSPNRMTLRAAQENFRRIGAMDARFLSHVVAEGANRYEWIWPSGDHRPILGTLLPVEELTKRQHSESFRDKDDLDAFTGALWLDAPGGAILVMKHDGNPDGMTVLYVDSGRDIEAAKSVVGSFLGLHSSEITWSTDLS